MTVIAIFLCEYNVPKSDVSLSQRNGVREKWLSSVRRIKNKTKLKCAMFISMGVTVPENAYLFVLGHRTQAVYVRTWMDWRTGEAQTGPGPGRKAAAGMPGMPGSLLLSDSYCFFVWTSEWTSVSRVLSFEEQ